MNEVWLVLTLFFAGCAYYFLKNRLAIFFPSTRKTIDAVMKFADIMPEDVFYDLGSGDGRILIEAAKYGCKVVGIEQNPLLNWIARRRAKAFSNISVLQKDIFKQDFGNASIIVAYLSRDLTFRLEEKIMKECKKMTKIILIDHYFRVLKPIKEKKIGFFYKVRAYKL